MVSVFESLKLKPNIDDPEGFERWMADHVQGKLKSQGPAKSSSADAGKKTHVLYTPKIANFSGSGDPKEVTYEAWLYEVQTLLREATFSKDEICTAARKSLRGDAASTVRRLGIDASIQEIIAKLSGIYGVVEDTELLFSQFYSAKQEPGESVSAWGCRLEDFLNRAEQQEPDFHRSMNDMLRTKFWSGLLPHLREASRHKLEHVRDFDRLRIEVRKIESELNTGTSTKGKDTRKAQVNAIDVKEEPSELEVLKGAIHQLTSRLDQMESIPKYYGDQTAHGKYSEGKSDRSSYPQYQDNQSYGSKNTHNPNTGSYEQNQAWSSDDNQRQGPGNYTSYRGNYRGNYRPNYRGNYGSNYDGNARGGQSNSSTYWSSSNRYARGNSRQTYARQDSSNQYGSSRDQMLCFRCNQPGHIAKRCRTQLPLN